MADIVKGIPYMEKCPICDMPFWNMDFGYACLECCLLMNIKGAFKIIRSLTSEELKITEEELFFGSF